MDTQGQEYADRLVGKPAARWKRMVKRFADVGVLYERNLRRQGLGRTLDVGCGVGRNLPVLAEGSLGVDHNAWSVEVARKRGLNAMTTEELLASSDIAKPSFDGMLLAHVIEHMSPDEGREVVATYLPYLRPGGKVLFVCPQERGYASDPTHVRWTTGEDLEQLSRDVGLRPEPWTSFPLPRKAGRLFIWNEFHVLARKPG